MGGIVRGRRLAFWLLGLALLAGLIHVAVQLVREEMESSRLQARHLSRIAGELTFGVEPGPSPDIHFPEYGPYDIRLGYSFIPQFVARLQQRDYVVTAQARWSPRMRGLHGLGLFPIFREQPQSGLDLLDNHGLPLYRVRFPQRIYDRFDEVPPLLVDALLFIENRELLDSHHPNRNPAVEWDRFTQAAMLQLWRKVDDSQSRAGGSTLATQIEKYRHSPEGRTQSPQDKLRQIASASLRAYFNGEDTRPVRHQLVVDYLNTFPVAARRGFGEVNGIGDGMWAWYGRGFDDYNHLLRQPITGGADQQATALAFKQALSLIIAQRRPAYYLHAGEEALRQLTDSHLRLLALAGHIPTGLRDAALPLALQLRRDPIPSAPAAFTARKDSTAMRNTLSSLLAVPRLYELDRFDLSATSTLDRTVQQAVTRALLDVHTPEGARAAGLYGHRLLRGHDEPANLAISFTLYERVGGANLLRVQTDNLDLPFDLNQGARLDLGSTAKLRTLVNYLQVIARLHERFASMTPETLAAEEIHERDALALWVRDHLATTTDRSLRTTLEAAMERRYSASTGEAFYTGGGVHRFANFEPADTHRVMSVRTAFQESVNLVFIRMMRDVVRHTMLGLSEANARLLTDSSDPLRRDYLSRFADLEGRKFLGTFYQRYRGKSPAEARALLLQRTRPTPRRLATAFRSAAPAAGFDQFAAAMRERIPDRAWDDRELRQLYERYAEENFSLNDRGYIAGVHPLELWLVAWLQQHPEATLSEVISASAGERQEVYSWLFKTRHKRAQDVRIGNLLELEAFREIHRDWQKLGYPFAEMTPSYAAALGASGDRPAALAELMGIIVNDGVRLPISRISRLDFAAGTPYETHLEYRPPAGERVLPREVAQVVRDTLQEVVELGTARRIRDVFVTGDGVALPVGGKTGTGDRRIDRVGAGGQRISSRVVGRSATFVFMIGDRFFGTLTTYVPEAHAADYHFTSGISVQLLKSLAPTLMPLLQAAAPADTEAQPAAPASAAAVPAGAGATADTGGLTADAPRTDSAAATPPPSL
jgi:membrane peptidoglycan carboxypeptidase